MYRTERFTTALEAGWQDYRHFLYRTFCSGALDLHNHFREFQ